MDTNTQKTGRHKSAAIKEVGRVAVIIPCHNEEVTIGSMIEEIREILPQAEIVVCDNASTDRTAHKANIAGALVLMEPRKGKGNAVHRLLSSVEADVYVLVDGDSTYHLPSMPGLIQTLREKRLGMVVGARVAQSKEAFKANHGWGNRMINNILKLLFHSSFKDLLSGYRVFSRGFVKSFSVNADGFTIESALAVHALQLRIPWEEIPTPYYPRPKGSYSKLSTWKDGVRISAYIGGLFIAERPLLFYGILAGFLAVLSVGMFIPVWTTYLHTGLVPRIPTMIVVGSGMVGALICGITGVLLHSMATTRKALKQLAYLRQ